MTRILHVVHGFPPDYRGGTEHYVDTIARWQQRHGHDVHVLCGHFETARHATIDVEDRDGLPVAVLHRYGLCGDRWDQTDAPHSEARVRAWLGRLRPDVVHVHHVVRLTRSVARTAAAMGIPVMCTFHDLSATCPCYNRVDRDGRFHAEPLSPEACLDLVELDPWQHREEAVGAIRAYTEDLRSEVAAATTLLAPSIAQRDLITALLDLPAGSVTAVPFGLLRPRPEALPSSRVPSDGPLRLVSWGALYHDKGTHVLVDAVRTLAARRPGSVGLRIFGAAVFPEYLERLRRLAAGAPIEFLGAYREADLDATDHDVAVLPTLAHESYGFVLDEALARGLPVIVSNLGALPERVGEAGTAVPPNDAAALASAIESLVVRPQTLTAWRDAIPRGLRTLADHAAELDPFYARAIALGPPAGAPAPPTRSAARLRRERALVNREFALRARG